MNTMNTATRLISAPLLVLAIAGCASSGFDGVKRDSLKEAASAESAIAKGHAALQMSKTVYENQGFWLNPKAMEIKDRAERLPTVFDQHVAITYYPAASMTDLLNLLSRSTNLRFAASPDLAAEFSKPMADASFRADMSLRECLDALSARQNVSWRWRDGEVDIYRFDTRVFQVVAFAGKTGTTLNMQNQNQGSGEGLTIDTKTDFWDGLKGDLDIMKSEKGRVTISQAMGTVTVMDLPANLSHIEAYLHEINEKRSKMIDLVVKVYSIQVSASQNFGVNWSAVYKRLEGTAVSLSTNGAATAGTAAGASSTLGLKIGGSGPFSGTTGLLDALAEQGNVALEQEFHQLVVSGEIAPMSALTNQAYVSKTTSVIAASVGAASSLETSSVSYGVNMNFTPTVIQGDTLQMQGMVDLASLDAMGKFSTPDGTSQVQLPQRSARVTVSRVLIRSGRTFLITGYQTNENDTTNQGLGTTGSDLWSIATGTLGGTKLRKTFVIVVTPTIVDATM